jgi:hypothetical protein
VDLLRGELGAADAAGALERVLERVLFEVHVRRVPPPGGYEAYIADERLEAARRNDDASAQARRAAIVGAVGFVLLLAAIPLADALEVSRGELEQRGVRLAETNRRLRGAFTELEHSKQQAILELSTPCCSSPRTCCSPRSASAGPAYYADLRRGVESATRRG